MTLDQKQELLSIATEAAQVAGNIIKQAKAKGIKHKGNVDLVTETDLASEAEICRLLSTNAPDIPILAEESGGSQENTRWIIDPLDGTTNFAHGLPHYAVSIGLEWEGDLLVGVIYNPCTDELFSAVKDMGATCNDIPIRVSSTKNFSQALLATGFPYDRQENPERYTKWVSIMLKNCQGIRRAGSAALDLAYVAAGRLDGFWEFGLKPWDMAAGKLLITEAGGVISNQMGTKHHINDVCIVAGNPLVHPTLLYNLQQ